ncbi:hypothetical protein [Thermococcus sibiricus]|uniref:hypothetical protein n=1 Tax=Thermococcus sibiricus TaxID=172049 RepID=UPI0024B5217D|nr:hypothetical protein [Thermococcus sibiricus]
MVRMMRKTCKSLQKMRTEKRKLYFPKNTLAIPEINGELSRIPQIELHPLRREKILKVF